MALPRVSLSRLFAPVGAGVGLMAAETLFTPLLAIGIAFWVHPLDPFLVQGGFPWVLLAPLLVGLRYGPVAGIGGVAVLTACWLGMRRLDLIAGQLPTHYFLGGLITVMISGEFASLWFGRLRRAEAMQHYLDQRLEFLTHQHYLLRLSHDRLEQDLISRPVSMRDALAGLRRLAAEGVAHEPLPDAATLLKLLSQYCQIERAAVLPCASDGTPQPDGALWLGAPFELAMDDPLIAFCRERDGLSHVAMEAADQRGASRYLVAAPLKDMLDRPHGLLVVDGLPFFALHADTLQMLNLLLGYYADSLASGEIAAPLVAVERRCPTEFAFELQRLWHIRESSGVKSAIVALEFTPRPGFDDLPMQIRRLQRSLDVTWLLEHEGHAVLLTLMPLAAGAAAEGYLARIDEWLQHRRDTNLDKAAVLRHAFLVDTIEPRGLLQTILRECHVSDQARTVRTEP